MQKLIKNHIKSFLNTTPVPQHQEIYTTCKQSLFLNSCNFFHSTRKVWSVKWEVFWSQIGSGFEELSCNPPSPPTKIWWEGRGVAAVPPPSALMLLTGIVPCNQSKKLQHTSQGCKIQARYSYLKTLSITLTFFNQPVWSFQMGIQVFRRKSGQHFHH